MRTTSIRAGGHGVDRGLAVADDVRRGAHPLQQAERQLLVDRVVLGQQHAKAGVDRRAGAGGGGLARAGAVAGAASGRGASPRARRRARRAARTA